MQQTNYIKYANIEELKKQVKTFYEKGKNLIVHTRKTRKTDVEYSVSIEGIYPKFFTVKSHSLNVMFTIQYVDVLTGNISIEEEKEGD
ncbi:MAG: hypothetical protein IJ308_00535 [Clostridia bacterium]|nr:hypothetical protein [Clostridia bacterium]